ncbi:2'-5' RNA ligase family protein [Rhizobium tumorigenes]|uniref:2'-5' RNA ligase family protein n=1 Tax=Rhizobium tumorigenes TaxID=2041385 RepID=UPI00241CEEEF|nr:2'-5' RNA ligase family protein [Rhizobium tumorigenes]WFS03250.1 2'-5' RNA ligase family protein [Rhizobium tumorigenes]
MKTRKPLILTARIADEDLEPFDVLRRRHFPSDRNFLRAHLTMFHRLPGEHLEEVLLHLSRASRDASAISADVIGLRHLGAGVAFAIDSRELQSTRSSLKSAFAPWLNSQDMQKWQPHITIQNKATRAAADALCKELGESFHPHSIKITGLDVWQYLGGPWKHEASILFAAATE